MWKKRHVKSYNAVTLFGLWSVRRCTRNSTDAHARQQECQLFLCTPVFFCAHTCILPHPPRICQVLDRRCRLFPIIISTELHFWKMIFSWSIFTVITLYVIFLASKKALDHTTPRLVYRWFYLVYRVCYSCAVGGYGLIMLDFFGFSDIVMDQVCFRAITLEQAIREGMNARVRPSGAPRFTIWHGVPVLWAVLRRHGA